MRLIRPFQYHSPHDINGVLELIARLQDATVLAGGTDFIPKIRSGKKISEDVVDLTFVKGLNYIKEVESSLRIGATTTHSEISKSSVVLNRAPVLAEAARQIGSVQIRNRGTIGGNLCNAAPSADLATPLIVLGANLHIASAKRIRMSSVSDFFLGPGKTTLNRNELLTEIHVPFQRPNGGASFIKLGRRKAATLAVVSSSAYVELKEDGTMEDVRIAIGGGVGPTPIRARKAEVVLRGKKLENILIEKAATIASEYLRPRKTSFRACPEYKIDVSRVLVKRALMKAFERAKTGVGV